MTEVLNRAQSSSSLSNAGSDDDKPKAPVPLAVPKPYSPPLRRHAIRSNANDSKSDNSLVDTSRGNPGGTESGARESASSSKQEPQSQSTFYAPNVMQPAKPHSVVGALVLGVVEGVSPQAVQRSDSPCSPDSEREPEYV